MATTRTIPARDARRRTFLLCIATLVLTGGASTATSDAATTPQDRPPIADLAARALDARPL